MVKPKVCPISMRVLMVIGAFGGAAFGERTVVNPQDELRFGWFDAKTTVQTSHTVYLEAKLCAAERGSKDVECVSLGKFKPVEIKDAGSIEIKRNSPGITAAALDKKVAEVTRGMRDPIVRIQLVLNEKKSNGGTELLAQKYVDFPPVTSRPKPGDAFLVMKVILDSDVATVRAVAEIKRP